jgi:uncharacterized membrane protein YdjX (TVP38/TMEM64 family)
MSVFKQRLSKKTKIQAASIGAAIFLIILLVALDVIFKGPITHLLTNKEEVITFVRSLGPFGWLAFIFLSAFETVIAPLPGQVFGVIGGYLFDWWGVLLTTIANIIGAFIVFVLSRKYGRPLVEKIINKKHIDKFDYLAKEKGSFIFFLIFLIPGLPNDIACYIAGLTEIPIKKLLVIMAIGRMPTVIATNMFGAGLGEDNIAPVVTIAVISSVIFAIVLIKRKAITNYINSTRKNKE